MEQSKIMETYNGVLERMSSRFMVDGKIAGKLFIVSSKKSEYDFLESYIRKKADDPTVMVCDSKLWEVKPSGTYSGEKFKVAVGGSNLPSRIIRDDENLEDIEKQGYDILDVPIEFKGRFEMDIQAALMNIAGISISHVTKFIPYPSLSQCYIEGASNPFTSNIISVGMKDSYMIQDFFVPERVPAEIAAMPIFIHIDASLTGDRTGIGGVAVPGYNYFNEYNIEKSIVMPTRKLMYRHVFSIGIQCPEGSEISFQKTRDFIYYLKFMLGWNIKGISLDGFQSADTKQQLISMGFEDTTIVSLDRTPDGYLMFKASLNEKRIGMLNIPELETEIIHLERDNMTGKIDHTIEGSKDISDGLVGALYNASLHEKSLSLYIAEHADIMMDVMEEKQEESNGTVMDSLLTSRRYDPTQVVSSEILDDTEVYSPKSTRESSFNEDLTNIAKEYMEEQKSYQDKKQITKEEIMKRIERIRNGEYVTSYNMDSEDDDDFFML